MTAVVRQRIEDEHAPPLLSTEEVTLSLREQLAALERAGSVGVARATLAHATPLAAFARSDDDAFWWADASGLQVLGVGVARRFEASGPDRFRRIEAMASEALSPLREADSGLRVFAGFAFDDDALAPRWNGFAPASAVLPMLSVERAGESWTLRAVVADATSHQAVASQVSSFVDSLVAPGPESPRGANGVNWTDGQRDAYLALVDDASKHLSSQDATKLVAARRVDIRGDHDFDAAEVAERLFLKYPSCYRFAFRLYGATFIGASPERLVRLGGDGVSTIALAGSVIDSDGAAESLLASSKDNDEHRHVVEHVQHTLGPLCAEATLDGAPRIRRLPNLLHLETRFEGRLAERKHVLRLVDAMHPTPAVGGVPTRFARRWVREVEGAERGWYSGPIGWFDARGDGEFAVAIRSGLLRGAHASLYAGAGIVSGSTAESELLETDEKLRPLLDALTGAT